MFRGTSWVGLGKNAASSGYNFYFDFLEAAVPSDVPDAAVSYPNLTAATDHDTDATYKLSPERLLWALDRAGLHGRLNHYLGVFWWAQRRRVGGSFPSLTLTFGGTWADGDSVFLTIGGTVMGKSVFPADTASTIAAHFCYFINSMLVGVWAEVAGAVLTIHCFTPEWAFTFAREYLSAAGTISESGSLEGGSRGTWEIDAGATPVLNRAARDWHRDFFAAVAERGWEAVASLSMEMVNPPDDPASGSVWAARFLDGAKVETSTGFASLLSTHCAFSDVVAAYQAAAYAEIAGLMVAAGLTPWLQFGEFCWWYFSDFDAATNPGGGMAFYDAYTASAVVSALGRALVPFRGAEDDPAVNSYADATFLRGLVKAHIDSIRAYVLATCAGARFELLWPYDVNYPERTSSGLGGRLLRYVNLPAEYEAKAGSGLDALKMEALAFGSVERHLDRAREAMRFPYTGGRSWPRGDVRYLMPWFNGGCPWEQEYLMSALREGLGTTLWAWDHLCLLSWPLPMPAEGRRVLSA
ncbi:MAG: hypothetical protein ACM3S5_13885 [Rhodospirillales bacterium]